MSPASHQQADPHARVASRPLCRELVARVPGDSPAFAPVRALRHLIDPPPCVTRPGGSHHQEASKGLAGHRWNPSITANGGEGLW